MNFPIRRAERIDNYPELLREGLTKPFKAVYLSQQAYIVEYESVQDVLNEQPNLELLKQLGQLIQMLQMRHIVPKQSYTFGHWTCRMQ